VYLLGHISCPCPSCRGIRKEFYLEVDAPPAPGQFITFRCPATSQPFRIFLESLPSVTECPPGRTALRIHKVTGNDLSE
jgi:hypothetical protein